MRSKLVLPLLLVGIIFFGTGCFSSNPADIAVFKMPADVGTSADSYVLQPPDEVEIRCTDVPELHLQSQRIRPDGMISFENIGEIKAAGKTPSQLAEDIRSKISVSLYELTGDSPIDVRIVAYQSKSYYVLGQFYASGAKDYTGRETVLDAVAQARLLPGAWEQRIQVIRPSNNPEEPPKIFEINLEKAMAHGDTSKNVLVEEGDIIYAPPTVLAGIGLVLEELLSPVGRAFSTVNVVAGPPGRR